MHWAIVGSGTRFLSGISYYTARLASALSERHDVSVVPMRRLLPRFAYPGKARVGKQLTTIDYGTSVVHHGVDWFWFRSIGSAVRFLRSPPPDVMVLQWWTGTVLHTYLVLARAAKRRGAKLIIELHEVQDTGEARLPLVGAYVRFFARRLMLMADAFVIHSEADRELMQATHQIVDRPVAVIPHGPYDHHSASTAERLREAPDDVCNILFFGTIRPYKGLEDLVEAFNGLDRATAARFWLTVVGETWEGWTKPLDLIERSPHRDRITLVNRYVDDDEVAAHFRGADVVALPYQRSSASGPLHIAMSQGLPLIVTAVGGLVEATREYQGAILVERGRPDQIAAAMPQAAELRGQRFDDPHSWDRSVEAFERLVASL